MHLTGPADARRTLNETRHFVANFRVAPDNRAPVPGRTLPDLTLHVGSRTVADMRGAFRDPDGDPLTYEATSSAPTVAAVTVSGNTVALTPAGTGMATITVTATDPGRLSATQSFTVTVSSANQPPEPVGTLASLTLGVDDRAMSVNVSGAFRDPDGDALTYGARSSSPGVATVSVSGSVVTVTPLSEGTSVVTVTATDSGGSNTAATQSFTVVVGAAQPFTDDVIRPGVTPVRAVHFTELRTRIDGLRSAAGLGRFAWTDPVLTAGVTPVRLVHLLELRSALAEAYEAAGRPAPRWTERGAGGAGRHLSGPRT